MELRNIIRFMELMKEQIQTDGLPGNWMFTGSDENILKEMHPNKIKAIWTKLEENIKLQKLQNESGFSASLFPFCLNDDNRIEECTDCSYKKEHKRCADDGSDLQKIIHHYKKRGMDHSRTFTTEFYLELLKKIKDSPQRIMIYRR